LRGRARPSPDYSPTVQKVIELTFYWLLCSIKTILTC
jgi:hypothetical protein